MSQLTDAADALNQHAKTLEAFKTCAQALYGLDSLAQAQTEADARRQAIEAKAADAQKQLNELDTRVKAQTDASEQIVANTHATVQSLLDDATAKAKKIMDDAAAHAKVIADQASADGDKTRADAAQHASDAAQAALDSQKAVDQAKTDLAAVNLEIDTANQTLKDITDKITAAQAKIASMLS
jgi:chromosome segregation ATPase